MFSFTLHLGSLLYVIIRTCACSLSRRKDETTSSHTPCMDVAAANEIPHRTAWVAVQPRVG